MIRTSPKVDIRMLLMKLIGAAAIIYLLFVALMYMYQRSMIYYPNHKTYTQAQMGVSAFTDIAVTTADGLTLKAWYSAARPGKPTILLFHGNAGSHYERAPEFVILAQHGYGLLLAGYRGFGGNPGSPSELGLYQDANAYIAYLTDTLKIPPSKIVLYGESLGTGIAVEMAVHHPGLGALVLESPYLSMPALVAIHYPYMARLDFLVRDKYNTTDKMDALRMPVLVLIGEKDTIVPASMGHTLYEALRGPKEKHAFPDADHMTVRQHGGMEALLKFLQNR